MAKKTNGREILKQNADALRQQYIDCRDLLYKERESNKALKKTIEELEKNANNNNVKFSYYNDTGRTVGIHPATWIHGCKAEYENEILHGEIRIFYLPENTYPWVKMWDYGETHGLQILVSPTSNTE